MNDTKEPSTEAEATEKVAYDPGKPHVISDEIAELAKGFPLLAAQLTKYFT